MAPDCFVCPIMLAQEVGACEVFKKKQSSQPAQPAQPEAEARHPGEPAQTKAEAPRPGPDEPTKVPGDQV